MTNPKDVLEWMAWKEERERNMTNEEWLRQCNTEQLAELLLRFYYQDFCMNTKRSVIEWLKQPHTVKE